MNIKERQVIRERVEKAVTGPWKRGTDGEKFFILANEKTKEKGWEYRVIVESIPTDGKDEEIEDQEHYNTDFIAHAREDVLKLLDELELYQSRVDHLMKSNMKLWQQREKYRRQRNEWKDGCRTAEEERDLK